MTNDEKQLHTLAARAAGYELHWKTGVCKGGVYEGCFIKGADGELVPWQPRKDDGAAFRLQVDAAMAVSVAPGLNQANAWRHWDGSCVPLDADPRAATREAILKTAALLGARIPPKDNQA